MINKQAISKYLLSPITFYSLLTPYLIIFVINFFFLSKVLHSIWVYSTLAIILFGLTTTILSYINNKDSKVFSSITLLVGYIGLSSCALSFPSPILTVIWFVVPIIFFSFFIFNRAKKENSKNATLKGVLFLILFESYLAFTVFMNYVPTTLMLTIWIFTTLAVLIFGLSWTVYLFTSNKTSKESIKLNKIISIITLCTGYFGLILMTLFISAIYSIILFLIITIIILCCIIFMILKNQKNKIYRHID